jgi:UDP-N-acetylglucosamine transferase subunit ALG13
VPTFPHYRTAAPETIEADMQRAELVVSHGGSGMVSALYRLRKPCVLVPRQVRYGAPSDEQVPFAKKWAALEMAVLCMDVAGLGAAIEECRGRSFTFRSFRPLGDAIRSLVLEG